MRVLRTGLLILAFTILGCRPEPVPVLRIATTTSIENSGLLPAILPEFQKATGIRVDAVIVGSGRALNLARRGDADAVITHDAAAERLFVDEGYADSYTKIMFNSFVIAGPPDDPANVGNATGPVDAMRRIAEARATFASRGDDSGTHSRERQLWSAAGIEPLGDWYLETGQGMGGTLRVASESSAYVLTDVATFAQLRDSMNLKILLLGGRELLNTYSVTVVRQKDEGKLEMARTFAGWLASGDGRDLISTYEINGEPYFTVWPENEPGSAPEDLPGAE